MSSDYIKFGKICDVHFSDFADSIWNGVGGQNEYRRRSTANTRFGEFKDTVNAENPACSFAMHGGDAVSQFGTGGQMLTQFGLFNSAAGLLTPDFYNSVGNHEKNIIDGFGYITWAQYFAAITNQATQDNKFPDDSNPKAYTFTKDGFLCIVLYYTAAQYVEGVEGDDQLGWLETILDGNSLPVLVFAHAYLHSQIHPYGNPEYAFYSMPSGTSEPYQAPVRTLLENSGLVQAVFHCHYHRAKSFAMINDIPYFSLAGSVLAPLAADNAYYIIEVTTNQIKGANQWMSAIKLTGYGSKGFNYDRSKFTAIIA